MISEDIIKQLIKYCSDNELSMAQIQSDSPKIIVLLFGKADYNINQTAIVAAHMLLSGAITGDLDRDNRMKQAIDELVKKSGLN